MVQWPTASRLARFEHCVKRQLPLKDHQDDRELYDSLLCQRQPKGMIRHELVIRRTVCLHACTPCSGCGSQSTFSDQHTCTVTALDGIPRCDARSVPAGALCA